ncbi:MAG: hypothetical protein F6K00_28725 [Leptolyngbya sp. SIOISBB]|nr:hypothetical protein [Leptolyngbya sp. SIOISBB]
MTIFQSPQRVAIALRDDTLTEREKLNFLWVLIALSAIFGESGILETFRSLFSVYGLPLLALWGIPVWGIIASYRVNRQGDNQNFVERFICLTASLSIRADLVYAVLLTLIRFLGSSLLSGWLQFYLAQLVVIGTTLYIYLRLKTLMSIATDTANE